MLNLLELPERARRRARPMLTGTGPADETGMPLAAVLEVIRNG